MFRDQKRTEIFNEVYGRDQALLGHILTPELFLQAALLCGRKILCSPLNLINLVWLAIAAARNPQRCFAALLAAPGKGLANDENFANSDTGQTLRQAQTQNNQRRTRSQPKSKRPKDRKKANQAKRKKDRQQAQQPSKHDPRKQPGAIASECAFSRARERMPQEFWVALLLLLGQNFQRLYADLVRWQGFRLMAVDGTRIELPDGPQLRHDFGTAKNAGGGHGAQARLVLLQLAQARFPLAYLAGPLKIGEVTMARQLLHGLASDDLVLLDAGFVSYGLFWQVQDQKARFCVRLKKNLNLEGVKELDPHKTGANDVLVKWTPKDSRGQWKKEGWPTTMELRLLTYHGKGFRPLRLLTNELDPARLSYPQWWGLGLSGSGEVLFKGAYNQRWEIELSYLEMKHYQGLDGGLRSRRAAGIQYEIAGHVLYYLVLRWLLAEAAATVGLPPLRLSFKGALEEMQAMWSAGLLAGAEWLREHVLPSLLAALASHVLVSRPERSAGRGTQARRAEKRAADARLAERVKQADQDGKAERDKKTEPDKKKDSKKKPAG